MRDHGGKKKLKLPMKKRPRGVTTKGKWVRIIRLRGKKPIWENDNESMLGSRGDRASWKTITREMGIEKTMGEKNQLGKKVTGFCLGEWGGGIKKTVGPRRNYFPKKKPKPCPRKHQKRRREALKITEREANQLQVPKKRPNQ